MTQVSITLPASLKTKISKIAEKSGLSFDECVIKALNVYAEEYEDVYKTDVCAVDNLERSFFLSLHD